AYSSFLLNFPPIKWMKSVILLTVWAYMSFRRNSHHDFRDFNGGNFHKIRYMPKMPIFTVFPAVLMAGIFIKFPIRPIYPFFLIICLF
ncbi:MAG: hypothetical protein IKF90_17610, partial [Parasporobacterium sp.]|nr:hypothetical protein [Parasporobacterium sp.]